MNTVSRGWVDYLLWLLLAIGLIGALKVSYENYTGTPCPQVLIVPICYVVLIGYTLMVLSVIINHNGCRHYFFASGWALAASIALIGSIAEFFSAGGVCPASGAAGSGIRGVTGGGGLPLCYVSLALLIAILVLFLMGPYKRSCDIYSAQQASNDAG